MSFLFGGTPFEGYADNRRSLNSSGGGGGGPTSSTTQTSNIPDWMKPQVETALGAATQQIFNVTPEGQVTGFRPYVPYSADPRDYVAKFSPMQRQSFESAANLQTPGQFAVGSDLATAAGKGGLESAGVAYGYGKMGSGYGQQAAGLAPQAQAYGQTAADIGKMGLEAQTYGRDVGEQARQYAAQAAGTGQQYAQMATSPSAVQAYMSPYQQAATDVQKREAQRAFDVQSQARKAMAARSGAFGGSRQAIEQSEAQRNLNEQLQNIQAVGDQAAYDRAIQSMQYGTGAGLQGLQGAQAGLGTALQGGQLGLSGIGQAMAGQQAGLQGLSTAGNMYGLGMQGAQVGLQGVQGAQAGYGIANQSAGTLGQLGTQQLAAEQSIINMQNQLGAQQQQRQQAITNQAIQNYATAQQYPQQQLAFYNSLLRGYATPTTTTATYQASPNPMSQAAGLGLTGAAAYGMMKKKGGVIKSGDGLEELGMYHAMKGE